MANDEKVPFQPKDDDAPLGDTEEHGEDAETRGGSGQTADEQRGPGQGGPVRDSGGVYKSGVVGGEAEADPVRKIGAD